MFILKPGNSVNNTRCRHLHLLTAALLLLLLTALPAFCVDVTLTVLDAQTEEPVTDAEVKTYLSLDSVNKVEEEQVTDSRGQCFLEVSRDKPVYFYISAGADGYLKQYAYWINNLNSPKKEKEGEVPEEYTIKLYKPDSSIGGIVKDESGYPVENVKVAVTSSFTSGRETTRTAEYETHTDSAGKWICDQVLSQSTYFNLTFSHPEIGKITDHIYKSKTDDLENLRNHSYTTTVYTGLLITGLVRDKTGNPIEGANIRYINAGTARSYSPQSAMTDTDGFYSLPGVVEGNANLIAGANGLATELRRFNLTEETAEQNFNLKDGQVLKGLVVDVEDNPIPGAYVRIEAKEGLFPPVCLWSDRTDEDGRFEWNSSPAAGGTVRVNCQGFIASRTLNLAPIPSDHVITLIRSLVISGSVYDAETTKPIEEFTLIQGYKPSSDFGIHWSFNNSRDIADKDGKYRQIFSSPLKGYYLRVEAEGYEASQSRPFKMEEGEVTYDFPLKKLDAATGKFEGTILEKYTNNPLPGAEVTLLDITQNSNRPFHMSWYDFRHNYPKAAVKTDENGKFIFEKRPFEKAMLTIEKDGYARTFIKEVNLSVPFFRNMAKGAVIRGRLLDDSGKPEFRNLVHMYLYAEKRINMGEAETDRDGYFKMENLPAGRYMVIPYKQQQGSMFMPREDKLHIADVVEGQDYVVDWDAPCIATLVGSYVVDNIPVEGALVKATSKDEDLKVAVGMTKQDGTFRLNLPFLGKYSFYLAKGDMDDPERISCSRELEIKPGLNRLDINTGSRIRGQAVFIKDDKPASNSLFFAYKKTPRSDNKVLPWKNMRPGQRWWPKSRFKSEADGKFKVLNNTGPGEWMIAYLQGGEAWMEEVIIPSRPFILEDTKEEKNVLFRIPETTMLRVDLKDRKSGNKLRNISISCRNRDGFVFSTFKRKVVGQNTGSIKWQPDYDEEGRLLFRQLPSGKYTMYSKADNNYPVNAVEFEIPEKKTEKEASPGGPDKLGSGEGVEFVDLTFELEKVGRIIFSLPENYRPEEGIYAYVGYYLIDPENKQPVLRNEEGPYFGGTLRLKEENGNKFFLPLHPGEYILQSVFGETSRYKTAGETPHLWTYTSTVTIEKGKDIEINIKLDTEKTE